MRKSNATALIHDAKVVRARGHVVGASAMLTQATRMDDTVVTQALQVAVLSRQVSPRPRVPIVCCVAGMLCGQA